MLNANKRHITENNIYSLTDEALLLKNSKILSLLSDQAREIFYGHTEDLREYYKFVIKAIIADVDMILSIPYIIGDGSIMYYHFGPLNKLFVQYNNIQKDIIEPSKHADEKTLEHLRVLQNNQNWVLERIRNFNVDSL